MPKHIPITINNIEYPTIKNACISLGLDYIKINNRINKYKWTREQAFEIVPPPINKGKPVIVNGITYSTQKEACKKLGLRENTVTRRINEGWSTDEVYGIVKRKRKPSKKNKCSLRNKNYESESELCRKSNININTYFQRRKKGKSREESLQPVETFEGLNGEIFKSKREMFNHYNIDPNYYYKSIKKGLSLIEIVYGTIICPNGNRFKTYKSMSESYNIPYSTFQGRLLKMSIEEAILLGPPQRQDFINWKDLKFNVKLCEVLPRKSKARSLIYIRPIKCSTEVWDYIFQNYLFKIDPDNYCGITEDGIILLKDGENDFKQIPFKEYIESLNIGS